MSLLRLPAKLWSAAALILAVAALGACSDSKPLITASESVPRRTISSTQPPEWRGYWRSATELWVYDMTPEVGLNSAFGDAPTLQRIRNAGMRLVRESLRWSDVSGVTCSTCGFGWAVGQARQVGAELLVVVTGARDAAMQATNPSNATERNAVYNQFASDMENLVRTLPGVRFWQLWNEPDASCEPGKFFNGSNSYGISSYLYPNRYVQGRNYADMLRIVYPRMKAAARAQGREVWIVTAGFTGTEGISKRPPNGYGGTDCIPTDAVLTWEFVRGMYENGGKAYFDILAIHTYGPTPGSPGAILDKSNSITYKMNTQWGDGNRPLWVTEFGSSATSSISLMSQNRNKSRDGIVFDSIQRDWYSGAVGVQRDAGTMQKILGFTYATPEGGSVSESPITNADPWAYGFGIFRGDRVTPRPAYNYLLENAGSNHRAENYGTRTGIFRIRTSGQVPVNLPYHYEGDVMVIENVSVNTLYPTVIPMRWPSSPPPSDPPPCGGQVAC